MTKPLQSYYDLIDNPSHRCPCILVLDTSYSMYDIAICELNQGLQQFIQAVKHDDYAGQSVEVGVVTFGHRVIPQLPLTPVRQIENVDNFIASGDSPMGAAVHAGLDILEARKRAYQKAGVAYHQPWLILMTDGVPTDEWRSAAVRCQTLADQKKLSVYSIAMGPDADLNVLTHFGERKPMRLRGLRFREFFQWLSASMERLSQSHPDMPDTEEVDTLGWEAL